MLIFSPDPSYQVGAYALAFGLFLNPVDNVIVISVFGNFDKFVKIVAGIDDVELVVIFDVSEIADTVDFNIFDAGSIGEVDAFEIGEAFDIAVVCLVGKRDMEVCEVALDDDGLDISIVNTEFVNIRNYR